MKLFSNNTPSTLRFSSDTAILRTSDDKTIAETASTTAAEAAATAAPTSAEIESSTAAVATEAETTASTTPVETTAATTTTTATTASATTTVATAAATTTTATTTAATTAAATTAVRPISPGGLTNRKLPEIPEGMAFGLSGARAAIESGEAEIVDWPASELPSGHPAYPDGDVIYIDRFFDNDLYLFIADTSKTAYDSYINALKSSGWIIVEEEVEDTFVVRANVSINMTYYEDFGVSMYIGVMDFDIEEIYKEYEWPDTLPDTILVYNDGNVDLVIADDEFQVYTIAISETSPEALNDYINELQLQGWGYDETDVLFMSDDNGTWYIYADYDDEMDEVILGIVYTEKYEYDFDFDIDSDYEYEEGD